MHCAAGKDRTGVIIAMALSVAGAEPAAISADYAASADRIDAILTRLRGQTAYSDGRAERRASWTRRRRPRPWTRS